jgi:hypothetical protein
MGLKSGWPKRKERFALRHGIAVLVAAVFVFITADAWCKARYTPLAEPIIQSILKNIGNEKRPILTAGNKKRGFEKNYQEWQSLTPQERDTMRHRMNQLNQMPPQDRQHFQRLLNKWQQLSPGERQQIERELDNWDNLPPQERDSIRRRFK